MYIPFISSRRSGHSTKRHVSHESEELNFVNISELTRSLERRKGGGGRGRGSHGTFYQSPTSERLTHYFPAPVGDGSSSSGKTLGRPSKVGLDGGSLPNNKKSATSYGEGGGRSLPIPLGKPFAGRIAGGGNRQGVYGNRYAMRFSILMERGPTDMPCVYVYVAYTGAVTLVWSHMASRDLASRISSGR